ncbi:hypothetical protein RSAG8_09122, partial [Rhizoctonia solani AG-8 WAC10335]
MGARQHKSWVSGLGDSQPEYTKVRVVSLRSLIVFLQDIPLGLYGSVDFLTTTQRKRDRSPFQCTLAICHPANHSLSIRICMNAYRVEPPPERVDLPPCKPLFVN